MLNGYVVNKFKVISIEMCDLTGVVNYVIITNNSKKVKLNLNKFKLFNEKEYNLIK